MFLSIVIFLSVAGNILVCIAIYTERSLRRIGNLFLASLAIADLFVASLVMTFAGVNDLLGKFALANENSHRGGHPSRAWPKLVPEITLWMNTPND